MKYVSLSDLIVLMANNELEQWDQLLLKWQAQVDEYERGEDDGCNHDCLDDSTN